MTIKREIGPINDFAETIRATVLLESHNSKYHGIICKGRNLKFGPTKFDSALPLQFTAIAFVNKIQDCFKIFKTPRVLVTSGLGQ